MRRFIVIEKPLGETPLLTIQNYQKSDPDLLRVPLTYAGRLDPMASGKLLVLIGDECKQRDKYDGLDKEYIFEILLGFTSDTGDVLGLPQAGTVALTDDQKIRDVARSMTGIHILPYPVFSSKTVAGKSLFQYALEGTLDIITVPKTPMRVYSMHYMDKLVLAREQMIERVLQKIEQLNTGLVKGDDDASHIGADFRKDQICKEWWSLQSKAKMSTTILRFRAVVSSGTYIRSLAPLIARELGNDGLAYSITRTKIGKYMPLTKHGGFWTRSY
jgi:tRNA U55 pseudouridine synthase TruB